MDPILVEDLKKNYRDKEALKGVSLSAGRGTVTALLGPNGAGKTTLVRSLMSLIIPDSGKVLLLGQDPFRNKSVFRKVGYVQELPNLPPFLTGKELVEMSCKIRGIPVEEGIRALEAVGMRAHMDRKIGKYSKGMIQRTALAEALAGSPEVLVMDEPNIGTDPALNVHMRDVIRDLRKGGTTVFMTSHELEDVRRLADKVVMIYGGRKFFEGTPLELVANFLGLRVWVVSERPEVVEEVVRKNEMGEVLERTGERVLVKLNRDIRVDLLETLQRHGARVMEFYVDMSLEEAYVNAVKSAMSSQ